MKKISDYFGCMVFGDRAMKERLAPDVYNKLKKTIDEGARLDPNVASAVAEAMMEITVWAMASNNAERIIQKPFFQISLTSPR